MTYRQSILYMNDGFLKGFKMWKPPARLRNAHEAYLHTILETSRDGFWIVDTQGKIIETNPAACEMTGYTRFELLQLLVTDIEHVETLDEIETHLKKIVQDGFDIFETRHRCKDGSLIDVEVSANFLDINGGQFTCFIRNITGRKHQQDLMAARLRISEYSQDHNILELLQKALDEAERLTDSKIGFFHFVDDDEETISLQAWSTNTLENMCTAEGSGLHYPLSIAGVWADCMRERKPLIHNDYASLANKRGLPEGHAPIIRELVVPVLRSNKIKAILGVGNREYDFKQSDVNLVSQLAGMVWDIVERVRMEEALRASEERKELALQGANLGTWDWDIATGKVTFNRRWAEMIGYDCDELESTFDEWKQTVHPDDIIKCEETLEAHLSGKALFYETEHRHRHKDGHWIWVLGRGRVIERDKMGNPLRACGTQLDITPHKQAEEEKLRIEEQLRQSQKMEAIGQLAGGVAHDFNNLLQVIIGYADIIHDEYQEQQRDVSNINEVLNASYRAKSLVSQLLAFSRQQVLDVRSIDLNHVIEDLAKLIRRVIGDHILLDTLLQDTPIRVSADQGQIEQIIMNLCVNAHDAMPVGGSIIIETGTIQADETYCQTYLPMPPGNYALLCVRDTGCGMSQDVMEQIFYPFFTTKEVGKGSGLGLSMVYGLVKQHHGFIFVESTEGKGSQFRIFLPIYKEDPKKTTPNTVSSIDPPPRGTETILLAEDDALVRKLTCSILERAGYSVIVATDGKQAVELFENHKEEIDLALFDVMMPGMSGKAAADHIHQKRPDLKVLFLSGYSMDKIDGDSVLESDLELLPKPCKKAVLLTKIREILDA